MIYKVFQKDIVKNNFCKKTFYKNLKRNLLKDFLPFKINGKKNGKSGFPSLHGRGVRKDDKDVDNNVVFQPLQRKALPAAMSEDVRDVRMRSPSLLSPGLRRPSCSFICSKDSRFSNSEI